MGSALPLIPSSELTVQRMAERLQKLLSQWGCASRRQAEQWILSGRVRLNGEVVHLGQKADPDHDQIEVDGVLVHWNNRPSTIYLLMHKPSGVVSTCRDTHHRTTVLDLLPPHLQTTQGIHPVGRLDAASTGAILLTNNGAVTFSLTHPSHSVPKTYHVWVSGAPSESTLAQWRRGVLLSGRLTRPAEVEVIETVDLAKALLRITLKEGRNRQIRRVAELLGHPVMELHRVAIGPIQLGDLRPGQHRPLRSPEIRYLESQLESIQLTQSSYSPNRMK